MADYHFAAKVIGRGSGRSAVAASAYRAGECLTDERTGLVHDFTRRHGVLHSEVLLPKSAPERLRDRSTLWNEAGQAENRYNRKSSVAQLARELELALPHELPRDIQIRMVRDFVIREFVRKGMAADFAVHKPSEKGDERNTHAHVMLTLRKIDGEGFAKDKPREWNAPEQLREWRQKWAEYQNRALERAGKTERVDHRSLEAQGIEREPDRKQGPTATKMERYGKQSRIGDERREVRSRNAERETLERAKKVIDFDLYRMRRQGEGFGNWANVERAKLQNQHIDSDGARKRGHQIEREALERQLQEFYGATDKANRKELRTITDRQNEKRGFFGKLVYSLTGREKFDHNRSLALRLNLEDSGNRKDGARAELTARQWQQTKADGYSHDRQRHELESRIEATRETYERSTGDRTTRNQERSLGERDSGIDWGRSMR